MLKRHLKKKKPLQVKEDQEFKIQALSDSCFSPISEQKTNTMSSSYGCVPTLCNAETLSEKKEPLLVKEDQEFKIQALHDSCFSPISEQETNTMSSLYGCVPTLCNAETLSEKKEPLHVKEDQEFKTQALCDSCFNANSEGELNTMSSCDCVPTYPKTNETSKSSSNIPLNPTSICSESMKLKSIIESKNQEIENLKRELKFKTQQLFQINKVEQMLHLCKVYLPSSLFLFVESHINNKNKRVKEFKYSNEIMKIAKTIFSSSPLNVYVYLKSILPLPPPFFLKPKSNLNNIFPVHPDPNN